MNRRIGITLSSPIACGAVPLPAAASALAQARLDAGQKDAGVAAQLIRLRGVLPALRAAPALDFASHKRSDCPCRA